MKIMNESVNEREIRKAVIRHFDYRGSDDFFDTACDIVERALDNDNEDEYENAYEAIDEGLIYTNDQWNVYMHYCQPGDPWDECLDEFTNDILSIVSDLAEEDDENEDEE